LRISLRPIVKRRWVVTGEDVAIAIVSS
jgi:hypothetical protein